MADKHAATGTRSSNTSSDNPNHLNTTIESGTFDEKTTNHDDPIPAKKPIEEEEDEGMDALIDELESQNGHAEDDEEEREVTPASGRVIPEDQLQTDTRIGLTESEVLARRKKYGMNQMKEAKENLVLKFLGYFVGPIQFVMEVCFSTSFSLSVCTSIICWLKAHVVLRSGRPTKPHFPRALQGAECDHPLTCMCRANNNVCDRLLLYSLQVLRIGSTLELFAPCFCSMHLSVSSKSSRLVPSSTN